MVASFGSAVSVPLLDGDNGTAQTINLIRRAVSESLGNPTVRSAAAAALRGVPAFDDRAACRAIFDWVRRNVRFTQDAVGHETISSAEWTIRNGIGDCDDINAVLIPSLLGVVGYQARLVTVTDDPTDPRGDFTHIYCEVFLNGAWVPMDAARPGAQFGTTVARTFRKRVWSLTDSSYQDLAGCQCQQKRGLQGVSIPPATVRQRGVAGMGFDWSALTNAISAAGQTAGSLISAFHFPHPVATQSTQPGAAPGAPPPSSMGADMTPVLLLGGLGLAVALIASKK